MRVPGRDVICVAVCLVAAGVVPPANAAGSSPLPQSPQAQRIIEQVEEIFHVRPDRADTCVEVLNGVLRDFPGTHQAALALAYLSYGNKALGNDDAATAFREQLERDFPSSLALGELLLLLAEKREQDGSYEEARGYYDKAISILDGHLDSQDGRAMRYTAGRCLAQMLEQRLADPVAAVTVLQTTAAKFPGEDAQASAWRIIADFAGRYGGRAGVPSFDSLASADLPNSDPESRAAAMLAAARVRCERGEYDASASVLQSLTSAYPASKHAPGVLLQRARVLAKTEPANVDARMALWKAVIDLYPGDPRCATAYMERANLLRASGKIDEAIAERKAGRDNAALVAVARGYMSVALGDIYRDDLHDGQKAIAAYQQARLLGAGFPAGWTAVRRLEAMNIDPWPDLSGGHIR